MKRTILLLMTAITTMAVAQTNLLPKPAKGFGKVWKAPLRLTSGATDETVVSLRSMLESGDERPDSAIIEYHSNDDSYSIKTVFSDNEDVITEIHYGWDISTGTWNTSNYIKEEYAFDGNGYRILNIYSSYQDNMFQYGEKEEYTYNPNGTPVLGRYYEYEDGEWRLRAEESYQYDQNGLITGGAIFSDGARHPLTVSGTLENLEILLVADGITLMKIILRFDPATMKILAREIYYLAEDGSGLILDEAAEYVYDAAGHLLKETSTHVGHYTEITEYTYDANGKKRFETYTEISDATADLNGDGVINDDDRYVWYRRKEYEYINNRLKRIVEYNDGNEVYAITTFYYSTGDGNQPGAESAFTIYSSEGYVTFTLPAQTSPAQLQLIDLSGRVAMKTHAVSGQPVSVQSLSDGVYIYQILAGGKAYKGKLVIR
jgi:YD repeat-containing protein